MAKIKYSALVSDMRNKLNGSVMSKNRYGSYVRNKVTPVNPQSQYQITQRSILSSLSSAWRALTQAERDAWTASAQERKRTDIFGDAKVLAGNALFVSANLNLLRSGSSQINTPGVLVDVPVVQITNGSVTVAAGAVSEALINLFPTTVPSGFKLIVYATPGVSPGITYVKNKYRYLGVFTASNGLVTLTSAYEERFGAPAVGDKVFFRAALVSTTTGQLGLPSEYIAEVEAA